MNVIFLDKTNLGDEGLNAFIEKLDGPYCLNELQLSDNGIHTSGISCLADAICSGKIVIQKSWTKLFKNGMNSRRDSTLCLNCNPLGLEGSLVIVRMLSSSYCQLKVLNLQGCQLTTTGTGLPITDPPNNVTCKVIGKQLCQMPQSSSITQLHLDGSSFTGEGIHILAGFMHSCPNLDKLFSRNGGITSNDLRQFLDRLTEFKSSSRSVCSKLKTWNLSSNELDDSGVSALIDHLPSLFPLLSGVNLDDNPVSSKTARGLTEEMKKLKEEMRKCEVRKNLVHCSVWVLLAYCYEYFILTHPSFL